MSHCEIRVGGQGVGHANLANTYLARMRGYMFRRAARSPDAILFERCAGIHMVFVTTPLLVFLFDKDRGFLKARRALPFVGLVWHPKAHFVLEVLPGRLAISLDDGAKISWH